MVKDFPDSYGIRKLITVLTVFRHWSLFWDAWLPTTSHALFL